MKIDARLDLHGLSLSQAESSVTHFIRAAAAADYRCVLVVTGKGRRKAESFFDESASRGRIRDEAPHWLGRPSLRPMILAVREAAMPSRRRRRALCAPQAPSRGAQDVRRTGT